MVTNECEWTNLFGQYYMGIDYEDVFEGEKKPDKKTQEDDDDMLFYVQSKPGVNDEQEVKEFLFISFTLLGGGGTICKS